MSLFTDASLVYVPSGVKDGKTYSITPTDGSGDLTFSRGSDIEATRVNANGYIEKAKVNLLLQSNTFSTTWSNVFSTETSGQAGYDGTNDAWELTKSSTAGRIQQTTSTSGVQTFSVYAKAGTYDWVLLLATTASGDKTGYFDLLNGVVGTGFSLIDSSIESVGGGYYRCSITFNETTTTARIYPALGDTNLGTSGSIYIQDAQINYGLVAQDYVETTTTSVVSGITNDLPRLDYSGGASCPSLKLEPSRQNLFEHSDYLSASFWFDDDIIRVQNTSDTLSPEGVYNAVKLTETATTARHRLASGALTISNTTYTASVFLKKGTARYGFIHLSGANAYTIVVDLEDGTITDTATNSTIAHQSVEDYGNGWYRCSVAGNMASVTTAYIVQFGTAGSAEPTYNNYVPQFLGSTSNNIYAYGAQLEQGSYPTSLIPTYGTSATRTAESCSKTSATALIGQTEGTAFLEFEIATNDNFDDNYPTLIYLSDGTSDNRLSLFINNATYSPARVHLYVRTTAGVQAQIIAPLSITTGRHKVAFAYANNDFVLYLDGVQRGIDGSGSVPACSVVSFIFPTGGANPPENKTKQALLFKTRLSNADLATLTTL